VTKYLRKRDDLNLNNSREERYSKDEERKKVAGEEAENDVGSLHVGLLEGQRGGGGGEGCWLEFSLTAGEQGTAGLSLKCAANARKKP